MFATDKLEVPWTFKVPVKNALVVLTAFDTYAFPDTYKEVCPDDPITVWVRTLLVLDTFRLVENK